MTEDQLEQETLSWLRDVGYAHQYGPDIAHDGPAPERSSYRQVILPFRLREAVHKLNPDIPTAAREDALKQVMDLGHPALLSANRHFHRLLVAGVPVEYQKDGEMGSVSSDTERFMAWRTIDGAQVDPLGPFNELQTLVRGVLAPGYLLDYLRYFVLFEDDGDLVKKVAGYHQFHAVRAAIAQVIAASRPGGSQKGGVVWHTQGSGKSISMTCFAARVMREPAMENPTIVVITDRNDLDSQLFGVFSLAQDLLREQPVQVSTRQDLRSKLSNRPSGGIVFATIQKFMPGEDEDTFPVLSDRSNIVVIADEAHRTQYGFEAKLKSFKPRAGVGGTSAAHKTGDGAPSPRCCRSTVGAVEKLWRLNVTRIIRFVPVLVVLAATLGSASVAIGQTPTTRLPNFYEHNNVLATAGQPTRAQFAALKEAGYSLVINLSPPGLPGGIPNEQELVEKIGLKYVHIPVDWDKPSPDSLRQFFDAMERHQGAKVLVHCWLNARSSAFVYAYRTLREGAPEAVERDVLTKIWDNNKGYELRNAPQWQAFLAQASKQFGR